MGGLGIILGRILPGNWFKQFKVPTTPAQTRTVERIEWGNKTMMTLHNNELCILFYPPRLNYFITSIGRKQFVNGSVLSFIFLGNISMHLWLVNYSCWVVVTSDKQYFLTGALHWHLAMENLWLTQQLWPQPYPLYLTQQKKHSSLYLFFYNSTLKATLIYKEVENTKFLL